MYETLRKFFRSRTKRRLAPSPRQDSQAPLPLDLTRDQVESLGALQANPAYKHYSEALERLYEQNLAALLRGMEHDAYLFQCGVCYALEQIAKLPHDLLDKVRELDARRTDATDFDSGSAIFPNTPFYDAWRARSRRNGSG
jgi:hypothetical protein